MAPVTPQSNSTEALKPGAIDVATALTLLGGNDALYEQVARSFIEEIQTLPERLAPLLRATDLSEAARTLHTTKGLALTVGAVHLGETCRAGEVEIKAALRTSSPLEGKALDRISAMVRESVTATTMTMGSALTGLAVKDGSSDNPGGTAGVQAEAADLLTDLKQLESLLKQSDMRAVDAHKQLLRVHGTSAQGRLEPLNAALYAFDFERGVVQCSELIRALAAPN
jgi:HPt (histidine-containing phosphotransfer) domain-containing protein